MDSVIGKKLSKGVKACVLLNSLGKVAFSR